MSSRPITQAVTAIGDLWVPDIWVPGMAERQRTRPNILNSIIVTNPAMVEAASGGGKKVEVPFLKEPDWNDEPQVPSTAPTINKIGSGKQVAVMCNRVSAGGSDAFAGGISGADPVGFILNTLYDLRMRQRQRTLLNILRGIFGFASAPGAGAAAFKALRNDIFIEDGSAATAANLFSSGAFIDTTSVFGDAVEKLERGVVMMHSVIMAAANKQDDIATIRDSEGKIVMRTYKGIPLIVNDILTRAGGTSGNVYETYIAIPGAVSSGDKPQTSRIGDLASLTRKEDADTNDVTIFDRTRFILHPQGCAWEGTPAGESPTNAELADEDNWSNVLADAKNAGIACLRTNG